MEKNEDSINQELSNISEKSTKKFTAAKHLKAKDEWDYKFPEKYEGNFKIFTLWTWLKPDRLKLSHIAVTNLSNK